MLFAFTRVDTVTHAALVRQRNVKSSHFTVATSSSQFCIIGAEIDTFSLRGLVNLVAMAFVH